MAYTAVTYTFSNGAVSDASQVNQNFTDLVNGLSDGTKDISVSAGTFAGNVSMSGNVTLGNAAADTITFTGRVVNAVPIVTGAWTFTFPSTAGTSTYVLQTDGSGTGSWVSRTIESVRSLTTTDTAAVANDFITVTTASAWTLTLFAASGNTGKILKIKKTSNDFNALTIDGNASETIDGATTTKISTQYEEVTLICDGSNWSVLSRYIPSVWIAYTPTGAFTNNTTYTGFWRRVGDSIEVDAKLDFAGAPNSISFTLLLPVGPAVDTAKLTTGSSAHVIGNVSLYNQDVDRVHSGIAVYSTTTAVSARMFNDDAASVHELSVITETIPVTIAASDFIHIQFSLPISGWAG